MTTPHFIPDHGGYEDLLSFQRGVVCPKVGFREENDL